MARQKKRSHKSRDITRVAEKPRGDKLSDFASDDDHK